jgi:hypothetical protein
MFGLGFSKVLFTIFAVLVVWYGYRWYGRVQARRRAELDEHMRRDVRGAAAGGPRRATGADKVEDLVPCGTCGAYVPVRGARACGRAGCPYPG